MKAVKFEANAYEEYVEWSKADRDLFSKINILIKDISRDYFKGLGKPEPLRFKFKGYWSRRITEEHRLIYKVENDTIIIQSVRGHY